MARALFWLLLVGTHPSPGHFTSQWLFPESWQPLGMALFTAPPWLRISIESPVKKPVNRLKLEQFHAVALQCNISSWSWPNWWNFELVSKETPGVRVVRSVHYWDKGSLAGGDTPIGAVKHSFIVQQLYCQTTTRDPDLSFWSFVFESFILEIITLACLQCLQFKQRHKHTKCVPGNTCYRLSLMKRLLNYMS